MLALLLGAASTHAAAPVAPAPPAMDPQQMNLAINGLRARLMNPADTASEAEATSFLKIHLSNPQTLMLVDSLRDRFTMLDRQEDGAAALAALARPHKGSNSAAYALYQAGLLLKNGPGARPRNPGKALSYLLEAAGFFEGGYGAEARLEAARLYFEQDALHEGLAQLRLLTTPKTTDPYLRERALDLTLDTLLTAGLKNEALALASEQMKTHGDLAAIVTWAEAAGRTHQRGVFAFLKKHRGGNLQQPAFAERYMQAAAQEDALTEELDELLKTATLPELGTLQQTLGQMDRTLDQLRVVETLIDKQPENLQFMLTAARLYVQNNFVADAERLLNHLLTKAPMQEAWRLKGRIALAKGDAAAAGEAYEKAVGFNPADPTAFERLAAVRMEDNDLEGTIKVYARGRETHKNPALYRLPLGRALELNLQFEPSLAEYLAALADPALQVGAMGRLETLLASQPPLKEKIAPVLESLKLPPRQHWRAGLLTAAMVKDLSRSMEAARQMQALSPGEEVLLNLAQQHLTGEFPELAENLLEERLSQGGAPPAALLSLAQLKKRLGKPQEALARYTELLALTGYSQAGSPVGLQARLEALLLRNQLGHPLSELATEVDQWWRDATPFPALLQQPIETCQAFLELLISLGRTDAAGALLANNPALPEAHRLFTLGMVLFLKGQTKDAQAPLLKLAESANGRYANDAIRLLALSQYGDEVLNNPALLEGLRLYMGGRPQEARDKLVAISPADPFAMLFKALSQEKLGEAAAAAQELADRVVAVESVFGPMLLYEAARMLHTVAPQDERVLQWVRRLEEDYPNNVYRESGRRLLSTP